MTDWKIWIKYAAIRAVKTVAQYVAASITVGMVMSDVNWRVVLSAAVVAGIYSLATSLAGLPEVKLAEVAKDNENCYVHAVKNENELRDELALSDNFEIFGEQEAVENE